MNKIYLKAGKALIMFFLSTTVIQSAKAQVLTAGDIAFTGYICNATGTDAFSFVLLVNIPSGTVINFTDNGWNGTALTATEQTCTWTSGSALVAGREIRITGPSGAAGATAVVSGSSISAGTVTGLTPSMATSGDQLLAYQGTAASPTFIAGIHMNEYTAALPGPAPCTAANLTTVAGWDPTCITFPNANASYRPAALSGNTAIWITPEQDNAVFSNTTGSPLATPAQVRAAIANVANWTANSILPGPGAITLPSGQPFLASIFPSRLLDFTVSNMTSFVAVNWKTENEQDMVNYEVERSFDGRQFASIKTIAAHRGSLVNNYSYNDADAFRSSNNTIYYRIKFVDVAGEIFYSGIKTVKLNKEGTLFTDNLPNPFSGILEFNLISKNAGSATIRITDMSGRTLLSVARNLVAGDNRISLPRTDALPNGIYTMEITALNNERKTIKLVKNTQ